MDSLGPGAPLIAVYSENRYPRNPRYPLTIGALYFVERTFEGQSWQRNGGFCHDNCGTTFVQVQGRPWGYCPNWFKPFDGADVELEEAQFTVPEMVS